MCAFQITTPTSQPSRNSAALNRISPVLLCTDRVGYGHIRGMVAVKDALDREGVPTKSVFTSQVSSRLYRIAWSTIDHGLAVPYKLFSDSYAQIKESTSAYGMQLLNNCMRHLDAGMFTRYTQRRGHQIVVASHVTASHLIRQPDIQVYLLGLDPLRQPIFE